MSVETLGRQIRAKRNSRYSDLTDYLATCLTFGLVEDGYWSVTFQLAIVSQSVTGDILCRYAPHPRNFSSHFLSVYPLNYKIVCAF